MTTPLIPRPLEEIASFLRDSEALENQISSGGDERLASAVSESNIVSFLLNQRRWSMEGRNIGRGNNRAEYDFKVDEGGATFFVDIKVSELRQADNTNCKAGIYHALTGLPPEESPVNYPAYFRALRSNCKDTGADFYFLVVGKGQPVGGPARAFVCTLRTLREVAPNGNNLPFQCKWSECMRPTPRAYEEAKAFLLENYRASLEKRSGALVAFQEYFPDVRGGGKN